MHQNALGPLLAVSLAVGCATGNPETDAGGDDDTPDAAEAIDGAIVDAAPESDSPGTDPGCTAALAPLTYDWETGDDGWTHNLMPEVDPPPVTWTFDHWERGTPTSGPSSCNSGTGCWATNLDGNYVQCQRAYLRSPAMDLSPCANTNLELVFSHAYDFWSGEWDAQTWYDGGLVELSANGSTWVAADASYPGTVRINPDQGSSFSCVENDSFHVHNKAGYVGANAGWDQVIISIPATLRTATFQLRFAYSTGVSWQTTDETTSMEHSAPGWYIDDLRIQRGD